ncbi:hypothetical protein [Enterococcus lactis]|nr:hypothetical protein [Enterococcus lactis]
MVNEVAENYTFGTLFSYYRVTDNGLVPIKQLEAEAVSMKSPYVQNLIRH